MSNHHRNHRRRMKPRIRRRSAPGTKPGTLFIASGALPTKIDVIAYDKDHVLEQPIEHPHELRPLMSQWPVVWVNVTGLGSRETLLAIAEVFRIHPLAMEDVVNVHQRAKVEPYDENIFCVLRMPNPSSEQLTEQLSLFLGRNYVVTIQADPGDPFDLVRSWLRKEHGAERPEMQADYLAYRLIDAAVDGYFPMLEQVGDHLDQLEDRTVAGEGDSAFADLHVVKRELLMLKRAIWPLRDAISEMGAEATPYVTDQTRVYLRDCHDHAVQLIDLLETYRDIAGDLRDFYMSSISNRMNDVMKTLTIISTVFLPLSFIAGVYGMNFNTESPWNMPELNWLFGYPLTLGLMLLVALGMVAYFWRHGWLDREARLDKHSEAEQRPSETNHREQAQEIRAIPPLPVSREEGHFPSHVTE
jgi:magnesium transporter